ncbi:MAG: glycosyl hydrolase 53 family protein [Bacteroidota bacterium]|mgnify:FL=1
MRVIVLFVFILTGFGSATKKPDQKPFYMGADLSYVNELLDCGAEYRYRGDRVDPYALFAEKGVNISRIRLWHSPEWTGYSDYKDVERAIQRSKDVGMEVLLDFHYSDTWADPQHQVIPEAWRDISNHDQLKDSLYNYTYQTLNSLHAKGLAPEFVQVGNEVNIEIMQDSANMVLDTINWSRNLSLLNAGLKAVKDFSIEHSLNTEAMIHIAQPENALWWFSKAQQHGIGDFDWIGLSYYPKWSSYDIDSLGVALDSLIKTYDKELMIVETAYPHTLNDVDKAGNILGKDALIPGYPATPNGQHNFLKRLIEITRRSGGRGVIYWEPAWITSDCSTLWGQGSHWDNATFFDGAKGNEALPVFDLFERR